MLQLYQPNRRQNRALAIAARYGVTPAAAMAIMNMMRYGYDIERVVRTVGRVYNTGSQAVRAVANAARSVARRLDDWNTPERPTQRRRLNRETVEPEQEMAVEESFDNSMVLTNQKDVQTSYKVGGKMSSFERFAERVNKALLAGGPSASYHTSNAFTVGSFAGLDGVVEIATGWHGSLDGALGDNTGRKPYYRYGYDTLAQIYNSAEANNNFDDAGQLSINSLVYDVTINNQGSTVAELDLYWIYTTVDLDGGDLVDYLERQTISINSGWISRAFSTVGTAVGDIYQPGITPFQLPTLGSVSKVYKTQRMYIAPNQPVSFTMNAQKIGIMPPKDAWYINGQLSSQRIVPAGTHVLIGKFRGAPQTSGTENNANIAAAVLSFSIQKRATYQFTAGEYWTNA